MGLARTLEYIFIVGEGVPCEIIRFFKNNVDKTIVPIQ